MQFVNFSIDTKVKGCYFESTQNVNIKREVKTVDVNLVKRNLVDARGTRTLTRVAKDTGISVSALSMYESGERIPRDEIKEKLARYYKTTVGFLFFGEKVHET